MKNIFTTPNPYATCRFLKLSTKDEERIAELYHTAESRNMIGDTSLVRLGRCMNNLDFNNTRKFERLAYVLLGVADSLFYGNSTDSQDIAGIEVHDFEDLTYLVFQSPQTNEEGIVELGSRIVFWNITGNFVASTKRDGKRSMSRVSFRSDYFEFKLTLAYMHGLANYSRRKTGIALEKLDDEKLESINGEYWNLVWHRMVFLEDTIKKMSEWTKDDLPLFQQLSEVARTGLVLNDIFLQEAHGFMIMSQLKGIRSMMCLVSEEDGMTSGSMSAFFKWSMARLSQASGEDGSFSKYEKRLIATRNKIAHGDKPYAGEYMKESVQALFLLLETKNYNSFRKRAEDDKTFKLPWYRKLLNRMLFYLENPLSLFAGLVSALITLAYYGIGAFCIAFFVWMCMGSPALKRVNTKPLAPEDKVRYYESIATKDTTAMRDFLFQYQWLDDKFRGGRK